MWRALRHGCPRFGAIPVFRLALGSAFGTPRVRKRWRRSPTRWLSDHGSSRNSKLRLISEPSNPSKISSPAFARHWTVRRWLKRPKEKDELDRQDLAASD